MCARGHKGRRARKGVRLIECRSATGERQRRRGIVLPRLRMRYMPASVSKLRGGVGL